MLGGDLCLCSGGKSFIFSLWWVGLCEVACFGVSVESPLAVFVFVVWVRHPVLGAAS